MTPSSRPRALDGSMHPSHLREGDRFALRGEEAPFQYIALEDPVGCFSSSLRVKEIPSGAVYLMTLDDAQRVILDT